MSRRLLLTVACTLLVGLTLFLNILPGGEELTVENAENVPWEHDEATDCEISLPLIQVLLPVTSRNLKKPAKTLEALPLFQYALPSFIETVEPARFRYLVSIAADKGDPWYDDTEQQGQIQDWILTRWRAHWPVACDVTLTFHAYANTGSRPTWATNYATQVGYEMGADYFYRINDDTVLHRNSWSSAFVRELASFRPIPGLGVTGPWDPFQKGQLLTMSFVGRPHLECFGTHFPFLFGNYFGDDWIMNVYNVSNSTRFGAGARMMSIMAGVNITHKVLKPRYEIVSTPPQYRAQLAIDQKVLETCVMKRLNDKTHR